MATHNLKSSPVKVGISKAHTAPGGATNGSGAVSSDDLATPANYQSQSDIDTRLLALSAGTFNGLYTQAYLDTLTMNDKIYQLKITDDATNYGML